MPRILEPTEKAIAEVVQVLKSGSIVGLPTETVYGLAANTFCVQALQRVYELKGRPTNNPLIAHVLSVDQARSLTRDWDDLCETLTAQFWPGPLTIIVNKLAEIPAEATAGLSTIAIRAPDHAVCRRVLEQFGGPLSAPSANRSGFISPTSAGHVAEDFSDVPGAKNLLIVDGGPCSLGIESTVLDLSQATPRILRPGSISAEQLREVIGDVGEFRIESQNASPGTSMRHYAPRTPTELVSTKDLSQRLKKEEEGCVVLGFARSEVPPPHYFITMPEEAEQYAAALYEALRRADDMGGKRILIVQPPKLMSPDPWNAIRDRLRRATGGI